METRKGTQILRSRCICGDIPLGHRHCCSRRGLLWLRRRCCVGSIESLGGVSEGGGEKEGERMWG